jgi:hypothetical protein
LEKVRLVNPAFIGQNSKTLPRSISSHPFYPVKSHFSLFASLLLGAGFFLIAPVAQAQTTFRGDIRLRGRGERQQACAGEGAEIGAEIGPSSADISAEIGPLGASSAEISAEIGPQARKLVQV